MNYTKQKYNELSILALFNLRGRMAMHNEMKSSFTTTLNVSSLPSGVYVLKVTNSEGATTEKIIVKHE